MAQRYIRQKVREIPSMVLRCFLDVNSCLKFFGVVFSVVFAWEKFMLSRLGFLVVCSHDCGHYFSVTLMKPQRRNKLEKKMDGAIEYFRATNVL